MMTKEIIRYLLKSPGRTEAFEKMKMSKLSIFCTPLPEFAKAEEKARNQEPVPKVGSMQNLKQTCL